MEMYKRQAWGKGGGTEGWYAVVSRRDLERLAFDSVIINIKKKRKQNGNESGIESYESANKV